MACTNSSKLQSNLVLKFWKVSTAVCKFLFALFLSAKSERKKWSCMNMRHYLAIGDEKILLKNPVWILKHSFLVPCSSNEIYIYLLFTHSELSTHSTVILIPFRYIHIFDFHSYFLMLLLSPVKIVSCVLQIKQNFQEVFFDFLYWIFFVQSIFLTLWTTKKKARFIFGITFPL